MMGVPNKLPNTPPFEMVKVPPAMSSIAKLPLLALDANAAMVASTSCLCQLEHQSGNPPGNG
jgi:hypothetical protein